MSFAPTSLSYLGTYINYTQFYNPQDLFLTNKPDKFAVSRVSQIRIIMTTP